MNQTYTNDEIREIVLEIFYLYLIDKDEDAEILWSHIENNSKVTITRKSIKDNIRIDNGWHMQPNKKLQELFNNRYFK